MGEEREMNEKELIGRFRIEDCTRCQNQCAEACPVYRHYGTYHPQQLAHLFLEGGEQAAHDHRLVWTCVTCKACTEACPFKVQFADFIRELRVGRTDYEPVFGGLIHAYQARQAALAASKVETRTSGVRFAWLDDSLDVNRGGDVLLFVGCIPLFDSILMGRCRVDFEGMARSAVRILNKLGISPTILEDEFCCGRDLYDIGERDSFRALARHNLDAIARSKAKRVVTMCPECAFTLKDTYEKELGAPPPEARFTVQHITEIIAENIGRLGFEKRSEKLALHDPCYLCRYLGVLDAPRTLVEALSAGKPVDLERRGLQAPCCAAGSWVNHGPHTRTAVNERLVEAHKAGAEALVTACPKCSLLFEEVLPACAWKQTPVVIKDLVSLAASRLKE
jgi:Fe-S oxidoreductase